MSGDRHGLPINVRLYYAVIFPYLRVHVSYSITSPLINVERDCSVGATHCSKQDNDAVYNLVALQIPDRSTNSTWSQSFNTGLEFRDLGLVGC